MIAKACNEKIYRWLKKSSDIRIEREEEGAAEFFGIDSLSDEVSVANYIESSFLNCIS